MTKKQIIAELLQILRGIEGDRFTAENIIELINKLEK